MLPVDGSKTGGRVTNSVDPDQKLHSAESDLDLQCLHRPVCLNILGKYGIHVRNIKIIWTKGR